MNSLSEHQEQQNMKRKHPREQFSADEDIKLTQLVSEYGEDDWESIASNMPNRNTRQCRERWLFYLSPSINKNQFTVSDDMKLIKLYNEYGPKWKVIAKSFDGRTHISLRNRMKQLQRKMLKTSTNSMYFYLLGKNNQIICYVNGVTTVLQSYKTKKNIQSKTPKNQNELPKKEEKVQQIETFPDFDQLFSDQLPADELNYFNLENDEIFFQ